MSTGELLPANPDILEGVDDLIQLSYLNEPSVLHNLQYRYSHDIIYVCIALASICLHKCLSVSSTLTHAYACLL